MKMISELNNKLDWVKDLEHNIRNLKASNPNYDDFSLNSLQKEYLKKAENYAYLTMSNSDLHGIGHIVRVIINIRQILKNEKADPFVTFFSGWLHDIGRDKESELGEHHAVISADMTKQFIISNKLELSQKEIEHIIECIVCHSYSAGKEPQSIEAKILSDADKIDALGSIGIYRVACYQSEKGRGIEDMIKHFHEKLLKLKDQTYTKTGRDIILQRTKFMEEYLIQMKSEYDIR